MKVGDYSPWGKIDSVTTPFRGIHIVSTSGHGGIKLSNVWNNQTPEVFRNKNGWYEEDCEAYIPMYFFPGYFSLYYEKGMYEMKQISEDGLKRWFPTEWNKYVENNKEV